MNDIEELLRDALQSAPTPETLVGDPVATIERRAGRARAFIAGGALAAVAVITTAVVVPLQLTKQADGPSRLGGPTATQPPSPRPSSTNRPPTSWSSPGVLALASGGGSLWALRADPNSQSGQMYVDRLDARTHARHGRWAVQAPGSWFFYGLGRVWLTGGGDGAYPDGSLQMVDPARASVRSLTATHQQLSGVAFAGGHAWVIAGRNIWEVNTDGAHVGTVALPAEADQLGIAATDSGQVWVKVGKRWLRIDPATRRVVDTVQWNGPMLGAAGGDAIWTYEGRLIALSPALLHQGTSVAEGSRIAVPGVVTAVAPSSDGGLFVVALDGTNAESDPTNLYYLSERALTGTAAINDQTPKAENAAASYLAPDNTGGVNYTDANGAGAHWAP